MNHKRITSIILSAAMMLSMTACDGGGVMGDFDDDDDTYFTHTTHTTLEALHREPSHDLNNVDATETFDDVYVDKIKKPWSKGKNLHIAGGTVRNFFCYYVLDSNNRQINTNYNYISTLTRPVVTSYPADEEGYVIYEVTYTQTFPIISETTGGYSSQSFFQYHNVGFLDSYTGMTFPLINMSTHINSFSVKGDVIYDGDRYSVAYYEFRETNWEDNGSDGSVNKETAVITSTSYFLVPEGYDGIVMYVYVADDTDRPIDEVLADNTPYFEGSGFFDEEEDPDDYEFFLITGPS